jgi:galactokinase
MESNINDTFIQRFNAKPLIVRSPGRINIIGEHTDYNEGFVLPGSIDKAIQVAVSKRIDNTVSLYAESYKEAFEANLTEIQPNNSWSTYILGVVDQLQKGGHALGGFNLVLTGDIPIGAGLSSSAALESATVFALNELFHLGLSRIEMVHIAQRAEHAFAGVKCGIMDMFASIMGKKDQVIKLDCRSLQYEYEPLQLDGYQLILFNTNVKHSLASSAYNERRQQCEQGVAWVKAYAPDVNSLRDVTLEQLDQFVKTKDSLIYKRCKFIVEEIARLQNACKDLENGNIKALGQKIYATHDGLSKAYEVSCKELDYLVETVRQESAVLGARMMGGGFGGCTINIIETSKVEAITERLMKNYKSVMGLELTPYQVKLEDGTSIV